MALKTITHNEANPVFWDIESLPNLFTVAFYVERTNVIHLFYRLEDGSALDQLVKESPGVLEQENVVGKVMAANPQWHVLNESDGTQPRVFMHNLATYAANERLARMVGLSDAMSVNDPNSTSSYPTFMRPVCDTDDVFDINIHPYLMGYNSNNYDTTILALYLSQTFRNVQASIRAGRKKILTDAGFDAISEEVLMSDNISHDIIAQADALFQQRITFDESKFRAPQPSEIRRHNDQMFTAEFRRNMPSYLTSESIAHGGYNSNPARIRRAMLASGRHIDVSALNEKMVMVALKRVLGILGYQILESKFDKIDTIEALLDLLAYNASDVINLRHVFHHPAYSSAFDIKYRLLVDYPETIYERENENSSKPRIASDNVRRWRFTPATTSAQFVSRILAPYEPLDDIEAVSFMYPSPARAAELGIEPFDVLEAAREFFYASISDENARASFDEFYLYYDSIRGRNFNGSNHYRKIYGDGEELTNTDVNMETSSGIFPYSLPQIPKRPTNIPYYRLDGTPTSCFVTFSTGGIHGQEANMALYYADNAERMAFQQKIKDVVTHMGIENLSREDQAIAIRKAKKIVLPTGEIVEWKDLLLTSSSPNESRWELNPKTKPQFKDISPRPLFKPQSDGSTKLDKRYVFTSVDRTIHEDFSSYYPLLLTNLSAFYNEALGIDRYRGFYDDKERYGKLMKDKSYSEEERAVFAAKREGVKLLLNSASGAGDTENDNVNIRMNNRIIAMRLIGQIFTWWIGQAQTFANARIPSTNTDGLYSADISWEANQEVLDKQSEKIHVLIEPEYVTLVSKDSNNRAEFGDPSDLGNAPILSASGGSLACWKKPQPTKSLAHPAAIDRAMVLYLRHVTQNPKAIFAEVPLESAQAIMRHMTTLDSVESLLLFQNIVVSSPSTHTYIFGYTTDDDGQMQAASTLGHTSRIFMVKPGTPGSMKIAKARAKKISDTIAKARHAKDAPSAMKNPFAMQVLRQNGYVDNKYEFSLKPVGQVIPDNHDIVVEKVSGINPDQDIIVVNEDLHCMSEYRRQEIIASLDLDAYVEQFRSSFKNNWMNILPEDSQTLL